MSAPEVQPSQGSSSARTIGLGAIWNVGAYLLPQVMTLALSVLVARTLGPTEQGVQSYLMFIAMTVGTIFGLGLPSAVEQAVSRYVGEGRPALVRAFGHWAVRSTAIPAVLSFVTVWGIGQLQYTEWAYAWVAAAVAGAMVTTHAVVAQGLNGLHEFRTPSGIGVSCQLVAAFGCVFVLLTGGGVAEFVAVQAAGMVASAVLTMSAFLRHLPRAGETGPGEVQPDRPMLREASHAALRFATISGVVVLLDTIVARRSEFVFLALFHHDRPTEIAFYSVAFAAAIAVAQVPAALVSVALPVVSRLIASGDHARVRTGYHSAQRLLLMLSAPAAGLLLGCGGALVLLAYGHEYEKSAHLLLIATIAPVLFGPIGSLASASLLGSGVPRAAVRAQLVAATVTVVADVALIWPFASYGAAVAGGLGILAGTASLMHQARRRLEVPAVGAEVWTKVVLTIVAAALPGALLTLVVGSHELVVLLVGGVGGLICVGLTWTIIRPLTGDHLAMVSAVVSRLPARGRRVLESFVSYEGRRRG
ncbi:oligosaccharide flippase family protein [Arsenicicoccus piscis]|uniref:Polysaccharide biosynthesis protein n=1 Tax=Arsenicicoccus piscis TaxID=673954 RepID=A0ABQ6HSR9_9MICO|nr:oligosaccharide flippase family protein [Arsenicicoccus piscis]MCH8628056.1 oligosaccharide flippase family protein [Arsenicicoccus piscis]GMA20584.1 hypothetical protein GCM10025862_26050 [Arsenicicoccus piscis]